VTAFKPGDKVLIRATVTVDVDEDGDHYLTTDVGRCGFYAPLADLEPAPEPPYVDPELVPGMVVMPLDESDTRRWFVIDSMFASKFVHPSGVIYTRQVLPERIRPVFDPREVTT
jgi:hypothetical protein